MTNDRRGQARNVNTRVSAAVAAYHPIWTVYGWWCPNDPRGSSSYEIRVERIADLGELHYGRKPVQPHSAELRRSYAAARDALKHPLLAFRADQFQLIADAISSVIHERRYTCYGCAIMPDHVHLLIRKHRDKSEDMLEHFQAMTRQAMITAARET